MTDSSPIDEATATPVDAETKLTAAEFAAITRAENNKYRLADAKDAKKSKNEQLSESYQKAFNTNGLALLGDVNTLAMSALKTKPEQAGQQMLKIGIGVYKYLTSAFDLAKHNATLNDGKLAEANPTLSNKNTSNLDGSPAPSSAPAIPEYA